MKKLQYFVWPAMFAAYSFAVYGLMPFHDDWIYATAPNPAFAWAQLLPDAAFWRPFDVLWGALMAKAPALFPNANRMVVVLAHTLSSILVHRVLSRLAKDRLSRLAGTLFFAFSCAMAATMFNSDAINQSGSFLVGVAALLLAMGRCGESRRGGCLVLGLVLVSMLFKESGVSWLGVIPVVLFYRDGDFRRFAGRVLSGAATLVLYFAVRFALMGQIAVGDGQYYAVVFDSKRIVANLCIGTLLPLSGVDALAYVCGHWALLALSVVGSAVFWLAWVVSAEKKGIGVKAIILAVLAVALAAPHCFFRYHPAELHFYQVVFAGAVFVALLPGAPGRRAMRCIAVASLVLLFAAGWFDRLVEVHRHSDRARALYQKLEQMQLDFSQPVYFISEPDPDARGYSVFTQSASHALYRGRACRAMNGWRNFDFHLAATPEQRRRIPAGAQTVRLK